MLPIGTADPVRFTPARYGDGAAGAPVYLIRPATIRERMAFRRDVAAAGARFVAVDALRAALREGVQATAAPDAAEKLVAILDEVDAAVEGGTEPPGHLLQSATEIE